MRKPLKIKTNCCALQIFLFILALQKRKAPKLRISSLRCFVAQVVNGFSEKRFKQKKQQ